MVEKTNVTKTSKISRKPDSCTKERGAFGGLKKSVRVREITNNVSEQSLQ